jgi:hypothetical protein
MIISSPSSARRPLVSKTLACDLVVGGGGLSGVCAAISAARAGLKVTLVQDRPVLGGNGSSEVRLWMLGATSHMGNNNRWAREGGVIDEFMVENTHRNREGNPVFVDALLLEMVTREPNITLLLNTVIHDLEKSAPDAIRSIRAFNPQNATEYLIAAPLFCDATGDGLIGYLAGAAFRMGAEGKAEFGEGMAPAEASGELLGHSLYFYSRDTGRPVTFTPPSFALADITKIPRYKDFSTAEQGCKLWWIEYGGLMDTVHDTEEIKWELWRVIYGVWHHIKNSGIFPEAETMTLEWVGALAGKRESRRFEGDHMLTQHELIAQTPHPDDVSYGGWAIDLHPADGVYNPTDGCTQYHAKGVYPIPYRTMYSRNIKNLFLAGRIISASHVAYGSTRVMATCGHNSAAVGLAAALCKKHNLLPRDIAAPSRITELQRELLKRGQYIPGVALNDPADLAPKAKLAATSTLALAALAPNGKYRRLDASWAMMLPLAPGPAPRVTCQVRASAATTLRAELRISSNPANHTPDTTLATREIPLPPGDSPLVLDFPDPAPSAASSLARQRPIENRESKIENPCYVFYIIHANPLVETAISDQRVTGILALTHEVNKAVAKTPVQTPPPGSGIDTFEFWLPQRRPKGENLACAIEPPIALYAVENLVNGIARPVASPNAWVAAPEDPAPAVTLTWDNPQRIRRIVLAFDTDFDHPMESVQMGHPESDMPFCVSAYKITDAATARPLVEVTNNHHTLREHILPAPLTTTSLRIEVAHPTPTIPAALFAIRVYEE